MCACGAAGGEGGTPGGSGGIVGGGGGGNGVYWNSKPAHDGSTSRMTPAAAQEERTSASVTNG